MKSVDGATDVDHDEGMSELVRRLDPEEWRLLREIRLRALGEAPYAFGSTREEEAARQDEWWIASVTALGWFVAMRGAEATGLIAAIPGKDSGDHHVISTWVAPEHRGSGVAQLLVAAVVAWALDHGASGLVLDVAENNPRARRFYEKTGFVVTGAAKPLRSHPGMTTYEMRLEIGARRRSMGGSMSATSEPRCSTGSSPASAPGTTSCASNARIAHGRQRAPEPR